MEITKEDIKKIKEQIAYSVMAGRMNINSAKLLNRLLDKQIFIHVVSNNKVAVCPHCNSAISAEVDNRFCLDCGKSFTVK